MDKKEVEHSPTEAEKEEIIDELFSKDGMDDFIAEKETEEDNSKMKGSDDKKSEEEIEEIDIDLEEAIEKNSSAEDDDDLVEKIADELSKEEKVRKKVEKKEPDLGPVLPELEKAFEENKIEYYKIGAMEAFSNGTLSVLPEKFIYDGFMEKDGELFLKKIEDLEEDSPSDKDDKSAYLFIEAKKKSLEVAGEIAWEKLEKVEEEIISIAIARGARLKVDATGKEDLVFTIPTDQASTAKFMTNYGLDPADLKTRKLSFIGFSNIIRKMADTISDDTREKTEKSEILDRGLKQLDWYYDTFKYRSNFLQFMNYTYGSYEVSGKVNRNILQDFLNGRKEYKAIFPEEEVLEKKIKDECHRISTAEKVSFKDFVDFTNDIIKKVSKGLSSEEKVSYIRNKINRYLEEAEKIKEADPHAEFYVERLAGGRINGDGGIIKMTPKFPFLIIRFGNTEYGENCIYAESTSFSSPFYAWKGKDSGDTWREVFKGSKGTIKSAKKIKTFFHYDAQKIDTLDEFYDKVHSYVPYS
ncbi:hypothetical protein IJI76_00140 [Candidatus Saccharibacteria bacterium]|nr:hypothetical protein [Candidatus Saccharibacteria bacterium]